MSKRINIFNLNVNIIYYILNVFNQPIYLIKNLNSIKLKIWQIPVE